jgi:hypothetical protein
MKEPRYEHERCTTMNGHHLEITVQPVEEPAEDVVPRASWPRRLLERRNARQLELKRQENDQRFAWRVEDIIAKRGLAQSYYSVGGRGMRVPHVVAVAAGPPVGLDVRMLPGQTPDDFAAQAAAIAYNLGVAEVRVVPLGPSLIRLELLPGPG